MLDLTLELEKIPEAAKVSVAGSSEGDESTSSQVTQIFHQTIHGSMQNVANTGRVGDIHQNVHTGNADELVKLLVSAGISDDDAKDFANILASEEPDDRREPFGKKAKAWIAKSIGKAADGTWKVGIGAATEILSKGALEFYGLS
ncbi:hypothetical protein WJS89_07310 [Sphingomicrobium sp. XHP0235]|uniref:hypothetical protein n=1 Tax=Sphingomicrobium aquimarinum TaxID=3133971 RepID=UPI0031FF0A94